MDKNILKYIRTESLPEGRVKTTVNLLMIDVDIMMQIVRSYVAGEINTIEMRVGSTIKHPKDKYDRTIALKECAQRFRKRLYQIVAIESRMSHSNTSGAPSPRTTIYLEPASDISKIELFNDKIRIYANKK